VSIAISKSSEIKPLDEYGNRFRTLFDEAGCTTGLPEGTIVTKPIEQLQPIAPGGSYAYPSPEEFAQFKRDLKQSPVILSVADLKARQDFQAEWQKKNRAIAPYIGAWKMADNQDVYVFPSKVAGRVCVLRQKDGVLSPDLGVSMTTDMRYDGNNGMFKVDVPEVVAGRSGKTQPLSALYGAIGSPDVSSVKGELEQAQCISELPKGGAIVAKKPILKITEPKKASTNIGTLSADVTPNSTESPKPAIVAKEDPVVKLKPPLKIELFQIELSINGETTKSFTDEQWKAFNIAARNWEKIIARDKDKSGQLRIIVTKDETQFSGEESWTLESGNKIRARVFEIDQSVNSRTNYPDIEVDNIFGRDYHNRITWNKELIDGFFGPLRPVLSIRQGYRTNLIAIMMHEIGHVLGLNHTKEPKFSNSLMCSPEEMKCANGSAGNRGKGSLTEDMIKELEGLGYQVDRQAFNELTWDWWF
jgi:hypothetical protein